MSFDLSRFRAGEPAYDFLGNEWRAISGRTPVIAECKENGETAEVEANGVANGPLTHVTLTFGGGRDR